MKKDRENRYLEWEKKSTDNSYQDVNFSLLLHFCSK